MQLSNWKTSLIKSVKIALAAILGIAIAGKMGLENSATAGIVTILSIRNTKRETLQSAVNRAVAYGCALLIAGACFWGLGFSLWAFALYLFLFSMLCIFLRWGEVLSVNAVLISHFLVAGNMSIEMLVNESLLLLIGSSLGILVNLHLRRKAEEFDKLAAEVDSQIKGILHRMSVWLPKENREEYHSDCFERLERALGEAKKCAAENYNNVFFGSDSYELDYITMRERQSVILKEIYENIIRIQYLPEQTKAVAGILEEIEQAYHRENTVEELLEKMDGLFGQMNRQPLPVSREEFEARAILFYILMQIRNVLEIKREFILFTH